MRDKDVVHFVPFFGLFVLFLCFCCPQERVRSARLQRALIVAKVANSERKIFAKFCGAYARKMG